MKLSGTFVDSVVRERSELKFSTNTGNLQGKSPHFNLTKKPALSRGKIRRFIAKPAVFAATISLQAAPPSYSGLRPTVNL
jgi:hypothetical protein